MNEITFSKTSILYMIRTAEEAWKIENKQIRGKSTEGVPVQNGSWIYREQIPLIANPRPLVDLSSHKTKVIHVHNNKGKIEKTEKEKKEGDTFFYQVISGIMAAIGFFFGGYFYQNYEQQKAAMKTIKIFDQLLKERQKHPMFQDLQTFNIHRASIEQLNVARSKGYTLSALGIAIGGSFLFFGSLAAPGLITAGKILLLGSSGTAAYTLGTHWDSDKKIQHHYRVLFEKNENGDTLISRIKEQLELCTEDMEIRSFPTAPPMQESYREPPPAYEEYA